MAYENKECKSPVLTTFYFFLLPDASAGQVVDGLLPAQQYHASATQAGDLLRGFEYSTVGTLRKDDAFGGPDCTGRNFLYDRTAHFFAFDHVSRYHNRLRAA